MLTNVACVTLTMASDWITLRQVLIHVRMLCVVYNEALKEQQPPAASQKSVMVVRGRRPRHRTFLEMYYRLMPLSDHCPYSKSRCHTSAFTYFQYGAVKLRGSFRWVIPTLVSAQSSEMMIS